MNNTDNTQRRAILGFDMEPDLGSWTPFCEGMVKGTPRILDVLAKHDNKATFLFTGDMAEQHPDVVKMVSDAEHEVGCHSLYHETVGDEMFPIPGVKPLLPHECYGRLKLATEMVQDVLGDKVTSFRAPRLWGSTAMVNALEDLGYTADLSYPMFFHKERLSPYHPSREDWTAEGDMKIVEFPNLADLTIETNDPHGRDRDLWPLFRTEGAESLVKHIDNMLAFFEEKKLPSVICLYMHPWEFQEMPQGPIHYGEGAVLPDPFLTKNCGEVALQELDKMFDMLKERGVVFDSARNVAQEF